MPFETLLPVWEYGTRTFRTVSGESTIYVGSSADDGVHQ